MAIRIHLLSLSASANSVSRACLKPVQSILDTQGYQTVKTDVRDYPPVWVDSSSPERYSKEYVDLSADLKQSDGYIFFLPIHCYTIPSTAKIFTEILFNPLKKKPMGFVTAAGGKNSFLAVRDLMTSLIFDSQALIYPIHVHLTEDELNHQDYTPNETISNRLKSFAEGFGEFTSLVKDISKS